MPLWTLLLLAALAPPDPQTLHELWQQYHEAGSSRGRDVAWQALREAGWPEDFAATVQRLRSRIWSDRVAVGDVHEERFDLRGRRYPFIVLVPESYDPQRSYPLRMILHGNARRPAHQIGESHWHRLEPFRSEHVFTVFPAAWDEAMWWSEAQVDNLAAILDWVRARYHVDPDRCYLTGLSDGGTGTFYQALRAPAPWAAFTPLIGHPWVLGNEEEGAEGDIFAANLLGRSLLVVNGKEDPLYPAAALTSYLDLFRRVGASVEFKVKPGGHNVRWWPEEAENFRSFRESHTRDPLPDHLVWETDRPRTNGRCAWVIVEAIGQEPAPDPDPSNTVLFPDLDPPTRAQAFPRSGPSGRVELTRSANTIEVRTRNVRRLTLLLGVDEFDFSRPIELIVNGAASTVEATPNLAILMEWAIRDGDPSALFAAELELTVAPARTSAPAAGN